MSKSIKAIQHEIDNLSPDEKAEIVKLKKKGKRQMYKAFIFWNLHKDDIMEELDDKKVRCKMLEENGYCPYCVCWNGTYCDAKKWINKYHGNSYDQEINKIEQKQVQKDNDKDIEILGD